MFYSGSPSDIYKSSLSITYICQSVVITSSNNSFTLLIWLVAIINLYEHRRASHEGIRKTNRTDKSHFCILCVWSRTVLIHRNDWCGIPSSIILANVVYVHFLFRITNYFFRNIYCQLLFRVLREKYPFTYEIPVLLFLKSQLQCAWKKYLFVQQRCG